MIGPNPDTRPDKLKPFHEVIGFELVKLILTAYRADDARNLIFALVKLGAITDLVSKVKLPPGQAFGLHGMLFGPANALLQKLKSKSDFNNDVEKLEDFMERLLTREPDPALVAQITPPSPPTA